MNNNFYKDTFNKLKLKSEDLNFSIEKNYSKRVKDEFLILRLKPKNDEYDIQIMIWKKLFTNCHIFQVSGHSNKKGFKIFFKIEDNGFKLFNFNDRSSCPDLYEKKHIFLDHLDENENERKKIYRDTKKNLLELKKLLKSFI